MSNDNNQEEIKQYTIRQNVPLSILDINLAGKIGIKEVMVIQRILYWTKKAMENNIVNNYHDGHWWCYNSLRDWESDFAGSISKSSLDRIMNKLERWGVIAVSNYNQKKFDDTKWYRIDSDGLNLLLEATASKEFNKDTYVGKDNKIFKKKNMRAEEKRNEVSQNGTVYASEWDSILPKMGQGCPKMSKPIPKNNNRLPIDSMPKISPDIKEKINYKSLETRLNTISNNDNYIVNVVIYFYKRYEECLGEQCGKISDDKLKEVCKQLKKIIEPAYSDRYDSLVRFLMDKYINDSRYEEHHIYDFALKMNDVYQEYIGILWCKGNSILEEYAKNPYIEKKGA